jgi:tetratricopeptide (TPR) repeat protein
MSAKFKSFAFSAFAFLLLTLPAFAQMTTVEGEVKGPDGKPLAGAVVKFDRTDIKGSYTVKTDKKGKYGHYGLPMGTYDVSVLQESKVVDQTKGVHTSYSKGQTVDFDLAKSAAADGAGAAAGPSDTERGMSKEQKADFEKKNKDREAQLAKNKELNDAFQAGKAALDAKQYDQAIEAFTKASTLDDKQVVVWSGLADALVASAAAKPAQSAELYEKGFDAYKKAIELKPDDAAYYNNYAIALAKDKKLDDAKTNLDMAAKLDPPGAGKYFYNMGALLVNGGQNDAAGEEFKKATVADPNYADAQYQYGVYLASKAKTDPSGKIIAEPGTIEALQKYVELKGPGCASATATSAPPGCELVGAAKEMATQLGGTLSTTYQTPNAPAAAPSGGNNPKKKK